MKYTVKRYNEHALAHECTDFNGKTIMVDLLVSGEFPEDTKPSYLCGKTFEIERVDPCVVIAYGIKLEEQP